MRNQLKWAGPVERMKTGRLKKKADALTVNCKRRRRRPRLRCTHLNSPSLVRSLLQFDKANKCPSRRLKYPSFNDNKMGRYLFTSFCLLR